MKSRRRGSQATLLGARELGANQPICKHFFRCLDTDGTMRDSIGGVTWTPSVATLSYDSTLKALHTDMTGDATPEATGGNDFHTFASGAAVIAVVAGRITDGTILRFALGDINTAGRYGIGLASQNWHAALGEFSSYSKREGSTTGAAAERYSLLADNDGKDVVLIMTYLPGSHITRYQMYDLATAALCTQTGVPAGIGNILYATPASVDDVGAFAPSNFLRFSGIKVYGAAYYELTSNTEPADWQYVALWSGAAWKNGYRFLNPRWNRLV